MNFTKMYDEVFNGITIDEICRRIELFEEHSASWDADETLAFILDLAVGQAGRVQIPRIPLSRRSYPRNANFIRAET